MKISIEINNVSLRRSPPFNCIDINDGGGRTLVLWLKREQAEALRKALDALYPPEAAPAENWCDGTHCEHRTRSCGELSKNGHLCTLSTGHIGNHVACDPANHNLHSWPATDALDPGAAEAIERYAEEHARDAATVIGGER